uniref:sialoadhesin-like isoform X1 n=2 Tax=Scatophagus argus TaxID=75038 RepID=UPI001ED8543C|nr:sialoadhesin-like isoform X1 [Scatophagus argus]
MKLPGLIDLSLLLILASNSKGKNWNISVERNINATLGSNVVIPCSFTYPPEHRTENVQVFWKKPEKSKIDTEDKNDQNAFIFHKNDTFVLEKYKGKTKLIGNKDKGNCSLMIKDIQENEPNIYLRVIAKGDRYSFKKEFVSISVLGATPVTLGTDINEISTPTSETTPNNTRQPETSYVAIIVSVAVVLAIIFIIGIVFFIKHKRSKSFIRENSGYYANFSRPSSNQLNREVCGKKQDEKLPEPKVIEDPIYMNTQAGPGQRDQSMDHTDNIYANVDYSS